jgi:hypothetical protein
MQNVSAAVAQFAALACCNAMSQSNRSDRFTSTLQHAAHIVQEFWSPWVAASIVAEPIDLVLALPGVLA